MLQNHNLYANQLFTCNKVLNFWVCSEFKGADFLGGKAEANTASPTYLGSSVIIPCFLSIS